ncbi:helix-turn-helix transcriptional regulator [Lachnospiraceae bacterium MD1]|uniref:Helix-turn-helix transcriptional regulator n=1 Tax=Variimorphobacter saccharofermentans TaxID=2755051 RepID=A0A839K429_9FIRM|nr:helix-turn-helix transcriptional regulator [Variimorphobacter saccharofermentans]MBB2184624.1 helix-turn-helix transcriptional regulator [Variimorphobacter saccharofermentans]
MKEENIKQMNPLRELREELHLTQKEFAEMAGIAKVTVSCIETGKHHITETTQEHIREKLSLYDDWYNHRNYAKKIDIDELEAALEDCIKNNFQNRKISTEMVKALSTIFNTEGLGEKERLIYIRYIYKLIKDMENVIIEAKRFIKNEANVDIGYRAYGIANDIMNLPGYDEKKTQEHMREIRDITVIEAELPFD